MRIEGRSATQRVACTRITAIIILYYGRDSTPRKSNDNNIIIHRLFIRSLAAVISASVGGLWADLSVLRTLFKAAVAAANLR